MKLVKIQGGENLLSYLLKVYCSQSSQKQSVLHFHCFLQGHPVLIHNLIALLPLIDHVSDLLLVHSLKSFHFMFHESF